MLGHIIAFDLGIIRWYHVTQLPKQAPMSIREVLLPGIDLDWILDWNGFWTGINIVAISVFCTVLLHDFEQLSSSAG